MRLGLRILGLRQLRVRAKFRQHFYGNRSIVFPTPNPVVTPTDCPVTSHSVGVTTGFGVGKTVAAERALCLCNCSIMI